MSLNQLSASAVQTIARRLLKLDVEAKKNLIQFEGQIVHIHIEDIDLDYYFSVVDGELLVAERTEQIISAAISGKLSAFISAVAAERSADSIFKGELNFSGDISIAKQFQSFAQTLNIDWHEPFSQVLGDPLGHTLATGLEKLSGWILQTTQSVTQDISEYLQEEARVTPSDSEQQHFFSQVDQLKSQTDRLGAKIQRLKSASLNKRASSSQPIDQDHSA